MAGLLAKHDDVRLTQFNDRSGVEAHVDAIQGPYVLLADLNLPEPVGGELVSTLRAKPNGSRMTAVILSASPNVEHVRGLAPDVDQVVEKPKDVMALDKLLSDILQRVRPNAA